ncbi:MAG: biotin attachment protein, partial [Actinomycetes bacterium]|nr:biotin attachment protein [Actinomycetes bacterium]
MPQRKVDFMITAFRDGFQSVYGARVFTDDFIPAVEAAAAAGLTHFEAGGGARFQSTYFYSNEDAFEMMDRFRAAAGPDADLQTLSRGVNVVGLTSQSRDIIRLHAKLFAKHGITTIRNFDALNDVNNLVDSGRAIVDAGARHEVCVTLMSLPEGVTGAHDPDFYLKTLQDILDADIPYGSVCFKDASGTTTPAVVHETVKRARKLLGADTHIVFHSHDTAGVCVAQYLSALDAGADQIDLSMAPVSGGTCQVDVMTMYHALRGTEYTLGIDPAKVYEAEEVFKECMKDYFVPPEARAVEPLIPLSPMPGGALTANTQMLRDNGLMDRYEEIAKNMGECVMKGGFGTSVTPVSQFYFQQAFNNTMFGPWQKFADGYGKMVLGYFGRTPVPPDPEVVEAARVQMGLEPTDRLVADINDENPKLGIEAAKKLLLAGGITDLSEENIFIAATCLDKGIQFLKGEAKANVRKIQPEPEPAPAAPAAKPTGVNVTVNGKAYAVRFEGDRAVVNGKAYDVAVTPLDDGAAPAPAAAATVVAVTAPMPGLVLRLTAQEGDVVERHDELLVLEAMKMESKVSATAAGTVRAILVKQGDQ